MDETGTIFGIERVEAAGPDVLIVGLELDARDAELSRLRAALPDARVVSFSRVPMPGAIEHLRGDFAGALLDAQQLDADVVVMAHGARKLALLAFAVRAPLVLQYTGGRLTEVTPAGFLRDRAPVVAANHALRRVKETISYAPVTPTHRQLFYVVSCARNAGASAVRCLDSVYDQTHPRDRVRHVYLDDASTDDTRDRIRAWMGTHPDHGVTAIDTNERRGGTFNTLVTFREAPPGSIVVELNGDDWFPDDEVLAFLDTVYADPSVWMTYNSCAFADGRLRALNRPYPEEAVRRGRYREEDWYAGALRTFRAELFSHVPDEELVDPATGTWWESADDMVIFLALLELSGGRARHVERPTYVYNHREVSEDRRDLFGGRKRGERIRALPRHAPLAHLVDRTPRHDGPLVSVLMPAFDAERYVALAIRSILEQTYDRLELVFVDDGSQDGTAAIAQELADADGRMTIVRQPNRGLVAALNLGLDHVRGDLVARMDADDVCRADRLERQVAFLDANPRVGAVGSWVERIDEAGRPLQETWQTPIASGVIGWHLYFESPLAHGAVTMRRAAVERVGGYDSSAPHAEDFALWIRLAEHTDLANIPEPLLGLRIHGDRVGVRHHDTQAETGIALMAARASKTLRRDVPRTVAADLFAIHRRLRTTAPRDPAAAIGTLLDLYEAYCAARPLKQSERQAIRYDVGRKLSFAALWLAPYAPSIAARAAAAASRIDRGTLVDRLGRRVLREAQRRFDPT